MNASTTGRTAASSAPNATSRIPIASGTAVISARAKSLPSALSNHASAVAPPNSPIVTAGLSRCAFATASSIAGSGSGAPSGTSFSVNWTITCRRSRATVSGRRSVIFPVAWTPARTAATARSVSGAPAGPVTSTVSESGSSMPASSMIFSACADRPAPCSCSAIVVWPAAPPSTEARTTNSSQPRTAAIRCRALQPPSAAARFLLMGVPWGSSVRGDTKKPIGAAGPPTWP